MQSKSKPITKKTGNTNNTTKTNSQVKKPAPASKITETKNSTINSQKCWTMGERDPPSKQSQQIQQKNAGTAPLPQKKRIKSRKSKYLQQ